jgi:predicted Zn-dependent peptidase
LQETLIHTLGNGARVVVRPEPEHPAAALGVWLEHGSRYEAAEESGLAHLLEHMLFKGTATYTALGLAEAMEGLGTEVEAWTGRELTGYSLEVLAEDAPEALALLAEMVVAPSFPPEELERERSVVAAEAAMVREDPEAWLMDELVGGAWSGHPAGRPVLGDPAVIEGVGAAELARYHGRFYTGGRMVVGVAGGVDPEAVLARAEQLFGQLPAGKAEPHTAPAFCPGQETRTVAYEQAHLGWAVPAPSRTDPRRYTARIANAVLGGSLTSVLFQTLRERHGLAYTVYSALESFRDSGLWLAYAACRPEDQQQARRLLAEEIERAAEDGVEEAAVERARHGLRAGLLLHGETLEQRLGRAVSQLLLHGALVPLEEQLAAVQEVRPPHVQQMLAEHWHQSPQRFLRLAPQQGD